MWGVILMAAYAVLAQTPSSAKKNNAPASDTKQAITPTALPNVAVMGYGTIGRLSKWTGFTSTNSFLGDSTIFETKEGLVGIGTTTPTSPLTVQGMIEITLGGLKFPDGSVQTSAPNTNVLHDLTLKGNGSTANPLGIAVPLMLSGSAATAPILKVQSAG